MVVWSENGNMNGFNIGKESGMVKTNAAMFCSCEKFPNGSINSSTKQKGNIGKMTIGDALQKLKTELSEMQEQDKGIFKQLMKVSANVDRLRREIRLEEESKRRHENEDDESDIDIELDEYEKEIPVRQLINSGETVFTKSIVSHNLTPQTDANSHQRCDSGIMADDSDNEALSTSSNITQRRQMFENGHMASQPKIQIKDSGHALSKCTVRVVDAKNVQRVSKPHTIQSEDKGELVRLGKFQVRPQHQVNGQNEKNISKMNGNSPRREDNSRSTTTTRKTVNALRDGLLVDISETGELKLHNNIKDVQKTAKARHSEVRNAVFATLNSVHTRKRASNPDLLDDDNNNQDMHYRMPLNDTTQGNHIPHSHSSDGILKLHRNDSIPRSRSLDGILDSNADDDFVEYDDKTQADDDIMPFRRYSSCNYGNRNPAQIDYRASGRIGYTRESGTSNNMENDAKAYFDALKSKKVMIRSISSASII